jgi:hypothetical protein
MFFRPCGTSDGLVGVLPSAQALGYFQNVSVNQVAEPFGNSSRTGGMRASVAKRGAKATHARAFENSPAIYGWVTAPEKIFSPAGTEENLPVSKCSFVPAGLRMVWLGLCPALKRWAIFNPTSPPCNRIHAS